jgi:hypothetical protein
MPRSVSKELPSVTATPRERQREHRGVQPGEAGVTRRGFCVLGPSNRRGTDGSGPRTDLRAQDLTEPAWGTRHGQ